MQEEEIIEMIIGVCRQHSANCAILFGSRAKGTSTERSDIDIAVTGVKDFSVMQEDLEALPTLFKVDLVNLDTCRNQALLEDIKQYGKKIYEKVSVLETFFGGAFGSEKERYERFLCPERDKRKIYHHL